MNLLETPTGKQWEKVGIRQHHGIVVPVFSLHSANSAGIGEFSDLIPLFPWCKANGFDIVQLLPLNDIARDTSPYGAISAYALNPIYLGLSQLPYLKHYPELMNMLADMQQLTYSQRINYPAVYIAKKDFLREYYRQASHHLTNTVDFQQFVSKNPWLESFALFKSLKIAHNYHSWEEWEPELQEISSEQYQDLIKKYAPQIAFHIFVQYLCFLQWQEVKLQANIHDIMLMGDIPILINRDSADVWLHRNLFIMSLTAGAPPDMYSSEGQNWGFPIINWEEMEREQYAWWKERLRVASQLYHIYRIDHVVGFYRIWSIPLGEKGSHGKFFPENESEWIAHGEKIMRMMLDNSPMLPIGEDLGTIPPDVRKNLRELGICGTKVMRWERMWNEDRRFIKNEDYIPASMTTVSTQDSETLQMWWKNNPQEAQDYARFKGWPYTTDLSLAHHKDILRDSHQTASFFHINPLQEYLALVPGMTWPKPEDERINVPGIIADTNWSYRFRPSVEEIVSSAPLKQSIADVLNKKT